jgi:very-short-patch-repair endonuclease
MPNTPKNNYGYNKGLRPVAHKLRRQMTKAEACLWKYVLRAGLMKGFHFRRQRPVFNYVVDFMCKELMLVIEVDGITHANSDVWLNDIKRQKEIESFGFTVLRFTDNEVLANINGVFLAIAYWIEENQQLKLIK